MNPFRGQLAMVRCVDRLYGLPVWLVEEFFRPISITRVPGADPRIRGIINCRGVSATVVDLRRVLGLPEADPHHGRMVMLETTDRLSSDAIAQGLQAHAEPLALLVDAVEGVVSIRDHPFHPPPPHIAHGFALGVYELENSYLTLLDLAALIANIAQATPVAEAS